MVEMFLPMENAVTFLLVVHIVTLVLATIGPVEDTLAFHFVVAPSSAVLTAITPIVDTYRVDRNVIIVNQEKCGLCL